MKFENISYTNKQVNQIANRALENVRAFLLNLKSASPEQIQEVVDAHSVASQLPSLGRVQLDLALEYPSNAPMPFEVTTLCLGLVDACLGDELAHAQLYVNTISAFTYVAHDSISVNNAMRALAPQMGLVIPYSDQHPMVPLLRRIHSHYAEDLSIIFRDEVDAAKVDGLWFGGASAALYLIASRLLTNSIKNIEDDVARTFSKVEALHGYLDSVPGYTSLLCILGVMAAFCEADRISAFNSLADRLEELADYQRRKAAFLAEAAAKFDAKEGTQDESAGV